MEAEIIERLTRIETHLESLVGNGQPGRIKQLEDSVQALRDAQNQSAGLRHAVTAAIGAGSAFVAHYLGFHK